MVGFVVRRMCFAAPVSITHSCVDCCQLLVGLPVESWRRECVTTGLPHWLSKRRCANGCCPAPPPKTGRTWEAVHACLLHRVLPECGQAVGGHGWWAALTLTSIARCVTACRGEHCRARLRVALRCLPPAVQAGLWLQDFSTPQWAGGVGYMLDPISPDALGAAGCMYMVVGLASSTRYVGRTKACGARNTSLPGLALRFREHMVAIFRPGMHRDAEQRYRVWRHAVPHKMCIAPCVWAQDVLLGPLEEKIICWAQPPMQRNMRARRPVRSVARPWPRFRPKPTWASEVSCNILAMVQPGDVSTSW